MTLVCFLAGFDQSSLNSEWATGGSQACAWESLDARDNDLQQFWSYLVTAVQTVDLDLGISAWALVQTSPPPTVGALLNMLPSKFAETETSVLLVLEENPAVGSKEVDDAVACKIDHLPTKLHLALVTREVPTILPVRLRVHYQLTELRQQDLRF